MSLFSVFAEGFFVTYGVMSLLIDIVKLVKV